MALLEDSKSKYYKSIYNEWNRVINRSLICSYVDKATYYECFKLVIVIEPKDLPLDTSRITHSASKGWSDQYRGEASKRTRSPDEVIGLSMVYGPDYGQIDDQYDDYGQSPSDDHNNDSNPTFKRSRTDAYLPESIQNDLDQMEDEGDIAAVYQPITSSSSSRPPIKSPTIVPKHQSAKNSDVSPDISASPVIRRKNPSRQSSAKVLTSKNRITRRKTISKFLDSSSEYESSSSGSSSDDEEDDVK
jgi:hypothetical protein